MTTRPLRLSQEALTQFQHSLDTENEGSVPPRRRLGSVSTRRSSRDQTQEHLHSRALVRRGSVVEHRSSTVQRLWRQGSRISFSGLQLQQPVREEELRLENTYRTGPEPGERFSSVKTQQVLQSVLDGFLSGVSYSPENAGAMSRTLAELLRARLKTVSPARYKLVCLALVGQPGQGQSLRVTSRALICPHTDDHATAVFQNQSLFAVAVAYGVYWE
ncbi:dynein light chain Tctex-type 5-A [Hoplias malabaricus]|uniref:dynein light chain Tctex-type 5-A n=1 Tax=Hoplias malabaricus TaxID=27720 RepID=UPI003461E340